MRFPDIVSARVELALLNIRTAVAEREIQRLIREQAHPETICEAIDWLVTLQRQRQRILRHRGTGRGRRA